MEDAVHIWLNVATVLAIFGVIAFMSCLGSTTFWGDE